MNKENPDAIDSTALYYAFSTIAQCAAALAALIGFFGQQRLERLQERLRQNERAIERVSQQNSVDLTSVNLQQRAAVTGKPPSPKDQRLQIQLTDLRARRQHLQKEWEQGIRVLRCFLVGTLAILVLAIIGIPFVGVLHTWPWPLTTLIILASLGLGVGPFYVVREATRATRALLILVILLGLVSPALASTHCLTYEEKSLGRLQTLYDDGTRAVSHYNRTLDRWESTITPPPGQTCTGRLHPKTRQWEGRCR